MGRWGGWILKRCLKVWTLQGGVDLKGGLDFSNIPGTEQCHYVTLENFTGEWSWAHRDRSRIPVRSRETFSEKGEELLRPYRKPWPVPVSVPVDSCVENVETQFFCVLHLVRVCDYLSSNTVDDGKWGLRSNRKHKEQDSRITHTTHNSNDDDKFNNLEKLTTDEVVWHCGCNESLEASEKTVDKLVDATRLLILIFLRSSKLSSQFAWRVQDCWHHQHRLWHWWRQHSESWVVILSSGLHTKPFQTNQLYNPSLSKLWLSVWILLHVLHIYAVIYLLWLRKEIVWLRKEIVWL